MTEPKAAGLDLDVLLRVVTVEADTVVRCVYSECSRRAPEVLVDKPVEPIPPDDRPGRADGTLLGKR